VEIEYFQEWFDENFYTTQRLFNCFVVRCRQIITFFLFIIKIFIFIFFFHKINQLNGNNGSWTNTDDVRGQKGSAFISKKVINSGAGGGKNKSNKPPEPMPPKIIPGQIARIEDADHDKEESPPFFRDSVKVLRKIYIKNKFNRCIPLLIDVFRFILALHMTTLGTIQNFLRSQIEGMERYEENNELYVPFVRSIRENADQLAILLGMISGFLAILLNYPFFNDEIPLVFDQFVQESNVTVSEVAVTQLSPFSRDSTIRFTNWDSKFGFTHYYEARVNEMSLQYLRNKHPGNTATTYSIQNFIFTLSNSPSNNGYFEESDVNQNEMLNTCIYYHQQLLFDGVKREAVCGVRKQVMLAL